MILADTLVATATLGLVILFALGLVQIWHIYVALFIRAVAGGFHQSAFGASVVLLVPREHLARVQGEPEVVADAIRGRLAAAGIRVEDRPGGPRWHLAL